MGVLRTGINVFKETGLRGLFRGVDAQAAREGFGNVLYFAAYEYALQALVALKAGGAHTFPRSYGDERDTGADAPRTRDLASRFDIAMAGGVAGPSHSPEPLPS